MEGKKDKNKDYGTSGAAVFAAISFLLEKKEEGLRNIEQQLLKLKSNESMEIKKDCVGFYSSEKRKVCEDITLGEFSLTAEDVNKYMIQHGKDLGFYLSTPGGIVTYTRWWEVL